MDKKELDAFMDKFSKMSRLEQEKIESSVLGKDSDYILGYKAAVDKARNALSDVLTEKGFSLIEQTVIFGAWERIMEK